MGEEHATAIRAEGISYAYLPGAPILEDWSASFETGTMTAICGPSGRGKSTLLYLLGLMLQPTSGTIYVGDCSTQGLSDVSLSAIRAHEFGFVFQDSALDHSRTVLDNVTETALYRSEPREQYIETAIRLLEQFDVAFDPYRKPGQISGGQAQRISLCRALLHDPSVIFADEPTGNLDPASSELVIGALRERADAGATVLMVTHSPEIAERCDVRIDL